MIEWRAILSSCLEMVILMCIGLVYVFILMCAIIGILVLIYHAATQGWLG
jgi:hypothetical protein